MTTQDLVATSIFLVIATSSSRCDGIVAVNGDINTDFGLRAWLVSIVFHFLFLVTRPFFIVFAERGVKFLLVYLLILLLAIVGGRSSFCLLLLLWGSVGCIETWC